MNPYQYHVYVPSQTGSGRFTLHLATTRDIAVESARIHHGFVTYGPIVADFTDDGMEEVGL